ncbi:30S ribosomal protein S17 [Candidatus Peribacteria bacterium]|nr:30S ribosomal protein S17 [Candidatus Peribacteria bacterium]
MLTKVGTITAAKMTETVTVTVHRSVFHPLYRKRYRVSTKFLADSKGVPDLGVGDTVQITECRPLSKRKRFKVTEVIKRAARVSDMAEEAGLSDAMNKRQKKEKEDESVPSAQ